MKYKKIVFGTLAALMITGISLNMHSKEIKKHNYEPKDGYVPTEQVAIKIAVAVWIPIYGESKIENEKPYNAVLKEGVWHVTGSLPKGFIGGVAEAEISKKSGCIVRLSHGK